MLQQNLIVVVFLRLVGNGLGYEAWRLRENSLSNRDEADASHKCPKNHIARHAL